MLLLPEAKLGENTLDFDYVANGEYGDLVMNIIAESINSGYVPGYVFEDYETFIYTCGVIDLGENTDKNIVAVPYIIYNGTTVIYGDTMVRSYQQVYDLTH